MRTNHRKSRVNYSSLEQRQLLAGDVSVFENGELFIRGDEFSNQIEIVANDNGEIHINGLEGTTINGRTDPFKVEGAIDLNGLNNRNAAFEGGLRAIMYGGHDQIDVRGLRLEGRSFISTGNGNDSFRFDDSTNVQGLMVLGGEGDDSQHFYQSRVMGDLTAITGNGHDDLLFWNSRVWSDAMLVTGEGDDSVVAAHSRFTGSEQLIITAGGEDRVDLIQNDVGETGLSVYAGEDRDRVFAEMSQSDDIQGSIGIHGQGGTDVLEMEGAEFAGDLVWSSSIGITDGEVVLSNTGELGGARYLLNREVPDRAAIRAELDQTTLISSVSWQGTYDLNNIPAQDTFVIEIYEDGLREAAYEDQPIGELQEPTGEPIATFHAGDGVSSVNGGELVRTDTGATLSDVGDPFLEKNVFNFDADIAFEIEAGKTYWVSIRRLQSDTIDSNIIGGFLEGRITDLPSGFEMGIPNSPQPGFSSSLLRNGTWGTFESFGWHVTLRS